MCTLYTCAMTGVGTVRKPHTNLKIQFKKSKIKKILSAPLKSHGEFKRHKDNKKARKAREK